MSEKWLNVKFKNGLPKDSIYTMISILVPTHILFILYLTIITRDPRTGIGLFIDIGLLVFILITGWSFSLFLIFRTPKSIDIKENQLLLKSRTGKIKKLTRNQIGKVVLAKSFASGELGCSIHYFRKKLEIAIVVDFESGKKVYDWYYGHKEEDGPRPITNYYWRDKKKGR